MSASETVTVAVGTLREEIPKIVEALDALAKRTGLDDRAHYAVQLAVDEIVTNAISYGYPQGGSGVVEVVMTVGPRTVSLTISDDGVPFDPLGGDHQPVLDGDAEDRPIGGLGIHFVRTLMDEVTYARRGGRNVLTCTKVRGAPGKGE